MKDAGRERRLLSCGRELVPLAIALFKALRLYDATNRAVAKLGERMMEVVAQGGGDEGFVELAIRSESLFVNGVRLREGVVGSAAYHRLVDAFTAARLRALRIDSEAAPAHTVIAFRLLLRVCEGELLAGALRRELAVQGVRGIELELREREEEDPRSVEGKEVARRIYLRSIGVVKAVFHELRSHDRLNARRVKRVVREMIESLETDPGYLVNLTSVKNYDEYTFNHSVNVGVLAIALGRAVGLTRRQLYQVGQAGMLHDLGKLCVPRAVLNKPGRLDPAERRIVQRHPAEGFLQIALKQGVSPETIAVALGAYEHHLNRDGSGYPLRAARRRAGLLSRIVAIVDRYDAMTSARVYRSAPIPPAKTLALLYHAQRSQFEEPLLRCFLNLVGYYPVGSVVRLSDDSVAVVVGATSEPELRHLPTVQLLLDPDGVPFEDAKEPLDLAAGAKEGDSLHVLEVLDPSQFGIDVSRYLI